MKYMVTYHLRAQIPFPARTADTPLSHESSDLDKGSALVTLAFILLFSSLALRDLKLLCFLLLDLESIHIIFTYRFSPYHLCHIRPRHTSGRLSISHPCIFTFTFTQDNVPSIITQLAYCNSS